MVRYTCTESGESYTTEEDATKLYCNIRGGANEENKVNFMYQVVRGRWREAQGIKLGLEGEVEKHSEVLGRSAQWTKTMRISSVPKYLCVQVGDGMGLNGSSCGSTGRSCRARRRASRA